VKAHGAEPMSASIRAVSAGYLRAMGAPLLQGRWPANGDLFGVLVNESFARKIAAAPAPKIYMPFERFPLVRSLKVVVRTAGDPKPAAPVIRKLIEIDRTQPLYELQTLEQALSDSIAPRRFNLFLLGTFAATAMLMALLGIYGVIAYSVAQRTQEIGIRMALSGIAVGSAVALGLSRLMVSLLYEVKPDDPQVLAAVAVVLAACALLACATPAFKAAFVDPIVALRHE
jgi:hypothetical protein